METNLIICGSGGQGVLLAGTLLAYASLKENKHITWLPSYGAEKRGGLSYCAVVISDSEIFSPVVGNPKTIIGLDNIGIDTYETTLSKNGLIILNSSLIKRDIKRKDAEVIKVPFNDLAKEIGNPRVLNMMALGVYIAQTKVLRLDSLIISLGNVISKRYLDMLECNKKALEKGYEIGKG
ncbi:MAG: 2-oxoacid:acceptor oxidoreductase family protein [Candidatus Firestonebacteria bacterium]